VTTAPVADGRTARSTRTRDAIADALLDLLFGGNLRPTAKEIAERAGVSLRSVYVHFDDLEDLFCVAVNRHFVRSTPVEAATTEGTLDERARSLVRRRVTIYGKLGAVGQATQLQAAFSPTLARVVRDASARSRAELERVFACELGQFTDGARRRVLAALDALTSPTTWDILREQHELEADTAQEAIVEAVVARLEAGAG
jgi:AcrR family transcriptional regulator